MPKIPLDASLLSGNSTLCSFLLENTNDGVIIMDNALQVLFFNDAAEGFLGRKRHDILGRQLFEAFPEAKGSVFEQHYTEAAASRQVCSFEVYFPNAPYTGWYQVRVCPIEVGIVAYFSVTTEQKKTMESLRFREAQLALAMEAGNLGLWDWRVDADEVTFNDQYYTMLGYEPGEFPASIASWETLLHPDDRAASLALAHSAVKGQNTGEISMEFRLKAKAGSWRWIYARGKAIEQDEEGRPRRLIGIHTDIHATKTNQQALEGRVAELGILYDLSRIVASTMDLDDVVRKAFDTVVEALSPDTAVFYVFDLGSSRPLHRYPAHLDLDNAEGVHAEQCLCKHVLDSREALLIEDVQATPIEYHITCVGEEARSLGAFPVVVEGETQGLLIIAFKEPMSLAAEKTFVEAVAGIIASAMRTIKLYDSLQRTVVHLEASSKELELARQELEVRVATRTQELSIALAQLKETDALKSAFLTNVSHDLRTPLTSILGFARLMQRDFSKHFEPISHGDPVLRTKAANITHNLEVVASEGRRLTRLINDFLDLSRIEDGEVQWHDISIPIAQVLERAVQSAQGFFLGKPGVVLNMALDEGLPSLSIDPDRITQVVVNLLSNAAKFTPSGAVTLSAQMGEGGVTISVADDGIGVAPSQLERIFDKFYQIGSDTLPSLPNAVGGVAGSGVGLSICRKIVEHYGGRIWATSQVGLGSTFTFSLPVNSPANQETTGFSK